MEFNLVERDLQELIFAESGRIEKLNFQNKKG